MVTQDLVHLKFEYNEAINARKQILSLEKDSLTIAQSIRDYNEIRTRELNAKIKLNNKIRLLSNDIKKLQKILPKADLPRILQKKEEIKEKGTKAKIKKYNPDIESQLKDIQNKLNALE